MATLPISSQAGTKLRRPIWLIEGKHTSTIELIGFSALELGTLASTHLQGEHPPATILYVIYAGLADLPRSVAVWKLKQQAC
jgi:hypothetical protein